MFKGSVLLLKASCASVGLSRLRRSILALRARCLFLTYRIKPSLWQRLIRQKKKKYVCLPSSGKIKILGRSVDFFKFFFLNFFLTLSHFHVLPWPVRSTCNKNTFKLILVINVVFCEYIGKICCQCQRCYTAKHNSSTAIYLCRHTNSVWARHFDTRWYPVQWIEKSHKPGSVKRMGIQNRV